MGHDVKLVNENRNFVLVFEAKRREVWLCLNSL